MKILTIKDASLEKIILKDPEYVDSVMYIDIRNGKSPLYFQTPKMFCEFEKVDDANSLTLLFNNKKSSKSLNTFYKSFKDIEECICKLISENSEKWFQSKNSYENICKNFFNTSLKLPKELDDPISLSIDMPFEDNKPTFEIYNQKQSKIEIKKIKKDYEIVTLLLANELIITENSANIVWEVAQIKVFQEKKRIIGCGIREENDIIEKIKIASLEPEKLVIEEKTLEKEKEQPPVEETEKPTKKNKNKVKKTEETNITLIDDDELLDDVSEYGLDD
jgi:hypothetical protein